MTTRKPEAWEGVSPLGAVDYDSVTVMAFLAEQFPDEDPATLFAREAYARRFNCWIQDQETGKHHSIEHHHWFHATVDGVKKSKDSPYFEWDPKTGWGRLFPQPDRDGRFIGGGARLRGPTAVAAGYVFANRAEVDNLLPESLPDMTDQGAANELPAQSEDDKPPAQPDPPRSDQRPKAAKGGRVGNPAFVRGPYYEKLEERLESQAKVLKDAGDSLQNWFVGMSRREFLNAVKPALADIAKLPSDRTLYDAGRIIVAKIEKR